MSASSVELYSGNLLKEGGRVFSKWQERFFVLTTTHLYYYSDSRRNDCKGDIPLPDILEVSDEWSKKPYGFCVRTRVKHGKSYHLAAADEDSMQTWKRNLEYALKGKFDLIKGDTLHRDDSPNSEQVDDELEETEQEKRVNIPPLVFPGIELSRRSNIVASTFEASAYSPQVDPLNEIENSPIAVSRSRRSSSIIYKIPSSHSRSSSLGSSGGSVEKSQEDDDIHDMEPHESRESVESNVRMRPSSLTSSATSQSPSSVAQSTDVEGFRFVRESREVLDKINAWKYILDSEADLFSENLSSVSLPRLFQAILRSLSESIAERDTELQCAQAMCSEREEDVHNLENDFETLREQLDEKIEYIENVEHSLLEKESHISVQSSRIEELSKKCSEYELKISSIEDEILHLTHSSELAISELTTSKRILEDRICELRQALQEASIEHRTEIALKQEELEDKCKSLTEQVAQLQVELSLREQTISDLQDSQKKTSFSKESLEEKENRIQVLLEEQENLSRTVELHSRNVEVLRVRESSLKELNCSMSEKIAFLEQKNEGLLNDKKIMEEEIADLKIAFEALRLEQSENDQNEGLDQSSDLSTTEVSETCILQERVQSLESQIESLRSLIEKREDEIRESKERATTLVNENESLRSQLSDCESSIQKHEEENRELQERVQSLESQIESLRSQLSDCESSIQKREEENRELQKRTTSLVNDIESLRSTIEKREDEIRESKERTTSLVDDIESLRSQLSDRESSIQKREEENRELQKRTTSLVDDIESLRSQLSDREFSIQKREEENRELQKRATSLVNDIESLRSSIEKREDEIRESKERQKTFEAEIRALRTELLSSGSSGGDSNDENHESDQRVQFLNGEIDALQSLNEKLEDESRKLSEKQKTFEDEIRTLRLELVESESKKVEVDDEVRESHQRIQVLNAEINSLSSTNEISEEKIRESQERIKSLETEIDSLRSTNEISEEKIRESQDRVKSLEAEIDTLRCVNEKHVEESAVSQERIKSLETEIDSLRAELSDLGLSDNKHMEENLVSQQRVKSLESEIESLQSTIVKLEEKSQQMGEKEKILEVEMDSLRSTNEKLVEESNVSHEKVHFLEEEIVTLTNSIDMMETDFASKQVEIDELKSNIDILQKNCIQLQTETSDFQSKCSRLEQSMEEASIRLQESDAQVSVVHDLRKEIAVLQNLTSDYESKIIFLKQSNADLIDAQKQDAAKWISRTEELESQLARERADRKFVEEEFREHHESHSALTLQMADVKKSAAVLTSENASLRSELERARAVTSQHQRQEDSDSEFLFEGKLFDYVQSDEFTRLLDIWSSILNAFSSDWHVPLLFLRSVVTIFRPSCGLPALEDIPTMSYSLDELGGAVPFSKENAIRSLEILLPDGELEPEILLLPNMTRKDSPNYKLAILRIINTGGRPVDLRRYVLASERGSEELRDLGIESVSSVDAPTLRRIMQACEWRVRFFHEVWDKEIFLHPGRGVCLSIGSSAISPESIPIFEPGDLFINWVIDGQVHPEDVFDPDGDTLYLLSSIGPDFDELESCAGVDEL